MVVHKLYKLAELFHGSGAKNMESNSSIQALSQLTSTNVESVPLQGFHHWFGENLS